MNPLYIIVIIVECFSLLFIVPSCTLCCIMPLYCVFGVHSILFYGQCAVFRFQIYILCLDSYFFLIMHSAAFTTGIDFTFIFHV